MRAMLNEADIKTERSAILLLIFIFGISIVVRLFNEVHIDDEPVRVASVPIHAASYSYAGTVSTSAMPAL